MAKEKEGSITVFLSLILLLVLAVIMTTIEAARNNGARVYTERALQTAMDSVLSEYYLPLFQDYHLFGLDGSYGTGNMDLETISVKLKDYMEYTFNPGKNLENTWGDPYTYFNLYGIKTAGVTVGGTNTLLDFDGELFVNQAVAYTKYKEIGNGIENFLPALDRMQESGKTQAVLEEKQDTEKSLYEIDKRLLALMRLIDGINISEKGVKINGNGKIEVLDNFVKKIQTLPVTETDIGIRNELVFTSLKGHYVDPGQIIAAADKDIDDLYENAVKKEAASERYDSLKAIDQSSIEDTAELSSLREAISNAKDKLDNYKRIENNLIKSINNRMKVLQGLIDGILPTIKSSLEVIEELIPMQEETELKLLDYEEFLEENRDNLSTDLYESLSDDLTLMEKYKGTDGRDDSIRNQYDFTGMRNTLSANENVLLTVKPDTRFRAASDKESWNSLKSALFRIGNSIKAYSCDKLIFDYSTLVKPVDSDPFFSGVKSVLGNGIMGLLIEDMEKISQKKVSGAELPSEVHKIQSEDETADFMDSLSNIDLLGGSDFLSGIIGDFSKEMDLKETAYRGVEEAGEILLLQEYLMEHYENYNASALSDEMKALDYELEYIIMGRTADYDNLKAVLMRILLIRTAMNLFTLLSDRKSNEEARILAAGFVGFTGLPALVEITKMIIITVWAFAESLVEVKALLQGKNLPLLKKGSEIQVGLYDLFYFNKEYIKTKAEGIKGNKTLLDLNYEGYLKLFLYMESRTDKSFRAMDLIQENIQLKYEDSFYMKNCIFGFQAAADFEMSTKFINLPFIRKMLNNQEYGYKYHAAFEYSY